MPFHYAATEKQDEGQRLLEETKETTEFESRLKIVHGDVKSKALRLTWKFVPATLSILLFIIATAAVKYSTSPTNRDAWALAPTVDFPERLSKSVLPSVYTLDFAVDLSSLVFVGNASITMNVLEATDVIRFHASPTLSLLALSVSPNTELGGISLLNTTRDGDTVTVKTSHVLSPGNYTLRSTYGGNIGNRTMRGFYASYYEDSNSGVSRVVAATHFEPIGARLAFPCFDEPALKAQFDISITVEEGDSAVSNMPVESIEDHQGRGILRSFTFARTPLMSTYLVAWGIGKLSRVEATTPDKKVKLTVYTQPGREIEAQASLRIALSSLDFFQNLYGIPYPLPKLDLWPMPDFSGEAMENFGLMIFEDVLMMVEPSSPRNHLRTTALLVAHEIAHQWFGDLVTMRWWDDLWLNEGFAEFMQYQAVYHGHFRWDLDDDFFPMEHIPAFIADSTSFSHPIAAEIQDPSQIPMYFDDITYDKGAAVLRMLENYLETEAPGAFSKGLTHYLTQHAYGTANTKQLWESLDSVLPRKDGIIEKMMDTWVTQQGYPVLTVRFEDDALDVQQCAFSLWHGYSECQTKTSWVIPITWRVVTAEKVSAGVLQDRSTSFAQQESCDVLQIINPKRPGFYRVQYTSDQYARLAAHLEQRHTDFDRSDRAGLVSDAIALMLSNRVAYSDVVSLLAFLQQDETSAIVWEVALAGFRDVELALRNHETALRNWVYCTLLLMDKVIWSVGWREEAAKNVFRNGHVDREEREEMRRGIIEWAILHFEESHPLVQEGFQFYEDLLSGKIEVGLPADMYELVYLNAIRHRKDAFREILEVYTKKQKRVLPGDLLRALSSTSNRGQQAQIFAVVSEMSLREQLQFADVVSHQLHSCEILVREYLDSKPNRLVSAALGRSIARCDDRRTVAKIRQFVGQENADTVRISALKAGLERLDAFAAFGKVHHSAFDVAR
ncbi:peptidase family M1-domain-containing protein [Fimicolochytrium jonesii]|uniref:peptidase family M1-domain-containing protein n=1 Tax=Fimicolochytrium jonesii TaxID=1396493 RepID=UPI0022FEE51B|nr:peptidase family M1-domain-containing protein [Fimicolochytrium jonesii]KAI8822157.1 peptidase family M1-domain-containing protein [Fimicolochytrium jonesii]